MLKGWWGQPDVDTCKHKRSEAHIPQFAPEVVRTPLLDGGGEGEGRRVSAGMKWGPCGQQKWETSGARALKWWERRGGEVVFLFVSDKEGF